MQGWGGGRKGEEEVEEGGEGGSAEVVLSGVGEDGGEGGVGGRREIFEGDDACDGC